MISKSLLRQNIARTPLSVPRLLVIALFGAALLIAAGCGSQQPEATATRPRVTEVPPTPIPWQPSRGVISVATAAQVARLGSLVEHNATVNQYLFARRTSTLWTRDGKGQIYAWNLLTGKPLYTIGNAGNARHMLLSADEAQLVTVGLDSTLRVFDAQKGTPVAQLAADQDPFAFNVSAADGSTLLLSTTTGRTSLWRPPTARGPQFALPVSPDVVPVFVTMSRDGTTIAVATTANQVRLYDGQTGLPKGTVRTFQDPIRVLMFSPDGRKLVAGLNGVLMLIPVDGPGDAARLAAEGAAPDSALAFSPDGRFLASASTKDFVYIWSLANNGLVARLPGHGESTVWLAWSPDSTLLITVAYGPRGGAYLWNVASFDPKNTQYQRGQLATTSEGMFSAAWAPDSQTIFLGDARGTVFAYGLPPAR